MINVSLGMSSEPPQGPVEIAAEKPIEVHVYVRTADGHRAGAAIGMEEEAPVLMADADLGKQTRELAEQALQVIRDHNESFAEKDASEGEP